MYVRIARFEGVDRSQIDEDAEQFRKMLRANERPDWMPEEAYATLESGVTRVISLVDRDAGVTMDLTFTRDADAAQRVDDALDSLNPPEGVGRRASVETYEVLLDEQLA
jgi:hypothetical protein